MLIKDIFRGRYYSKGRGSMRYLVLDDRMWYKYYKGMGEGYGFGVGRNRTGRYTEEWGVPCVVYARAFDDAGNLVPYGGFTTDKPTLIHPKEFVDEWTSAEAMYAEMDAAQKARQAAREAENKKAAEDAKAIGVILTNLGVEGFRVHTGSYSSDVTIPQSALASMLAGLQAPSQAYDVSKDEEVQKVLAAKDAEVDITLANNKQIILDLLYELDVTWDEYFSGEEVEVAS